MIAKYLGNTNVEKRRANIFIETDFNTVHKMIFNSRRLLHLETPNHTPNEIDVYRRFQAPLYLSYSKKLVYEISNIRKVPMINICKNTIN